MDRKQFVKKAGITVAGLAVLAAGGLLAQQSSSKVRVALIGVGLRGQQHLKLLLRRKDVEVRAICDIDDRMLAKAKQIITENKSTEPTIYKDDPYAWRKLLSEENLDAVVISTPWEWHKEMILGSLDSGLKYVATEVMLGTTVQDHWDIVKRAEEKKAHVMMLENVCYRRDVMAVLNMVRQGVFGELVHLQGGYQHDLRNVKFNNGIQAYGGGCEFGEKGWTEARWRTQHSVTRNGDLYPTHGIGPIAQCININRGNQFVNLSSYSSKARGLHNHVVTQCGADHPNAKVNFKLGDIVTTSIGCANGETILLQHDTSLPRPYSLGFRVQGTNGIWMDVNSSIYIEGKSPNHDQWENAQPWLDKYDHPLWSRWSKETEGAGHGGMDFFVIHAFIEAIKAEAPTPMDVYDAAAWSVITPLSEQSIANNNQSVNFPDFTNGNWKNRKPVFALDDGY